jgi:hypothetical protein
MQMIPTGGITKILSSRMDFTSVFCAFSMMFRVCPREGNGRMARLFATLMALQAGLPPLDFGELKGMKRKEYFAAIRAGLDRDYKAMEEIFSGVIQRTLRGYEKQLLTGQH